MTQVSRVLFVAWQDPETRRILPVARVVIGPEMGYEFAYIEAVSEAEALGFLPLLSFPELQQVYRSRELWPLLHNRLLQSSRPDYADYLDQLGLAANSAEPFTVLGRSGGRRATDTLELFSPPTATADGRLSCVVLARGVRHLRGAEGAIASLQTGDRLEVIVDPTNQYNQRALKVCHNDAVLGYLPDYLAFELSCNAAEIDAAVRKLNLPPAPVHHRLLLEVTFPATDPLPFSGGRYRPLSAEASALAA
jgi:hypothetical protein